MFIHFRTLICAAAFLTCTATPSLILAAENDVIDAMMFKEICAETLPSFDRAPKVLKSMPFDQDTSTKAYHHRNINMTVQIGKLNGELTCRMTIVNEGMDSESPMMFAMAAFSEVWKSDNTVVTEFEDSGHLVIRHPKGHIFQADFTAKGGKKIFVAIIRAAQ
jgi:hypothetical protein